MDSTGVKLYGEGEWKVRLHGAEKRRTWRKLHLRVDHRTQEAVACSMTDKYVLDRRELPGLLRRSRARWRKSWATGLTTSRTAKAIHARGARSVIPPKKRARVRGGPEFRDRNAAVLRGREVGRDEWKKEAGYHRRSLAETAMMRLKTIFSGQVEGARVAQAGDGAAGEVRGA